MSTLIILGSSRKNGNTDNFVTDSYGTSGYTLINLLDKQIAPYNYEGLYPADDDFLTIVDTMLEHENIVIATPVYWYSMSGLMKMFFDRLTDIVTIKKTIGRKLAGKTLSVIAAGYDDELPPGFEVPFEYTARYLDMVYGGCRYRSIKD